MRTAATRTKGAEQHGPIWLPAIGFYVIILVLAAATFAFVLGLSTDVDQTGEWLIAGLVGVGVIIAGVFLREVGLRSIRERRIAERHRLDRNLRHSTVLNGKAGSKFTLEQNAAALENIKKRSDAANLFGRISGGHREVFELCDEYRGIVAREMPNIHPDSPRLRALRKGISIVSQLHRSHMLRWAEIEARSLTNEAQSAETVDGRAAYAKRAKAAIDFALSRYPDERTLTESAEVLDEILRSLKGSGVAGKPHGGDAHQDIETAKFSDE